MKFNLSGYKIDASDGSLVPGWNITVTDGSIQKTNTTGSNGFYEFKGLVEGTYTVFEEQRSGWMNITPSSQQITSIDQDVRVNFTNRPTVNTYNISGRKINNIDNMGISGWNITITDGSTQTNTSTNETGYYKFINLVNGTYYVTEEDRSIWTNITPLTQEITILGQDNQSVDFRNQLKVFTFNLSGYMVNASDNTALSGWNITLTDGSTQTIRSTDSTGYYEFVNLKNGIYTISEELKPEWVNVTPLSQNRTISGANEQNVNFTNKPLEIVSDDFSKPTLDPLWKFSNPKNDAILTLVGTGTNDALLSINISSGKTHDIWTNDNNAPRLMQNASNKDFEIEVKFQSNLSKKYQIQGVLVQQDNNNFIRFDFESDGAYTKTLAATFANGAGTIKSMFNINTGQSPVPMYMRVKRVGNQWTMNYSTDGVNWIASHNFVYTLKVTSVGLFVGNAGLPTPNHIGLVDYFFNTNSPIIPEDPSPIGISGYVLNASDGRGIPNWNITIMKGAVPTTVLTNDTGFYNFPYLSTGNYTVFEELQPEWANVTPLSAKITINGQSVMKNFTNKPLEIVSDDFSAPVLNTGLWTIVDPQNDSTISVTGTDTKNATLSISVPSTTQHGFDNYNYDAPRIMQRASNKDFEIEVKFQSEMTSVNQMEGLIIQQDNNKSIRFDFERDWFSTNIIAVTFDNDTNAVMSSTSIGGSPVPLYMRVKRVGDQWTMNYSTDGMNWTNGTAFTYVLKVTSVGPFVGQSYTYFPPAYTGLIDYFFNTDSPIVPEDPAKFNLSGYKINGSDGSGIPGWNVTITDGSIQTTKTTGSNGFYEFKGLIEGNYTVFEEQRSGWKNFTPRSIMITGLDQNISENFTNLPTFNTYKLSGYKINASDNKGIPGWNITITKGSVQTTTSTDPTGYYEFADLINGTYSVTEEQRQGWVNVTPTTQVITINGQDNLSVNFRNQPRTYTFSISGYMINTNNNTGIAGWNITITNGSAQTIKSTNGAGYYEFINLVNGTYTIFEELKPEWVNVTPLSLNRTISGMNEQNVNFTNKPLDIVSDDFRNTTLNPFWTFVNPKNDANLTLIGNGTKDALLSINISSGKTHDIWTNDNNAPRLMQNASNKDFEVEVKFQSILSKKYQIQGVLVQQDSNNFIRFDFESDGVYTKAFAATFANGAATAKPMLTINNGPSPVPMYMRVKRVGNQWMMNYSTDGVAWTAGYNFVYTLKVTSVGFFVGNAGVPTPNHVGLIDYFFNNNSRIIPEDPTGTKFNVSGFKINNSDKAGLPGWNITLSNSTMPIIDSTVTDNNGSYKFTNISNGAYTVSEEIKPDWMNVTPFSREIIVNYDDINNLNFTNRPVDRYNISGYKINGANGSVISGWNITLTKGSMSINTSTNNEGFYKFSNLVNGTYNVTEETRQGWKNITLATQKITVYGSDVNLNFINGPQGIESDDFSIPNPSRWTIIDPLNDSSFTIDGLGTSDVLFNMTIPAGTSHDVWDVNNAPRIVQYVNVNDFEIEAKFNSLLNKEFQMQGIIIEQDKDNFLRFDFNSDGVNIRVLAANFTNGTLPSIIVNTPIGAVTSSAIPLYLRVKRVGDNWTEKYSLDGTTWIDSVSFNRTLNVTSVGPFIGNSGGNPAFTGLIDYFFNTNSPINPEDALRFNVSGFKIDDINYNGVWDDGELGIPDWNISLFNNDTGLEISKTKTGILGQYAFHNLINGTYRVTEETKAGYIATNNTSIVFSISGNDINNLNFTNSAVRNFNISGFKIDDRNRNGIWDAGEVGIPNWNISLLNSSTGVKITDATTNPSGRYIFSNLLIGTYQVTEETKPGYIASNSTSVVISLSNKDINNLNFTNYLTPKYNVSGFIIDDRNRNGIWDAGEPGIQNWNISIFNSTTGLKINNTTTDISGRYVFSNLVRGTYTVTEETKTDYLVTNSTSVEINILDIDINNINFTNSQIAPNITSQTGDLMIKVRQTATFNVVATGTKPLTYQWQKNGVNITGTNSPSYTIAQTAMSDNGSNYRVIVTNSLGSVTSNPSKLMVRNIVSDDFSRSTLNTLNWTFINPRNDATVTMTGAGTSNALLNINVPGGTEHDVWSTGNFAPRVMQTADNTDFQVEAKFQSMTATASQMQGIIIEQDSYNYLRFDFTRIPASTNVFAASFAGGVPTTRYNVVITSTNPIYLRINRTGDQWKEYYSSDGNNWILAANFNYPMIVSSVGPFAGNAGSNPAFTSKIDYFFNSSSPIVPEDPIDNSSPSINLWYGNPQSFGQIGVPQKWVNIVGNVYDEYGVARMNYSLNNGSVSNLSIGTGISGTGSFRLASIGDFNIEIDRANLVCGNNRVDINATDYAGNNNRTNVSINYSCNNVWPKNYNINWSNVTKIQDVAQVVDGLWTKESNSVRPAIIGYDRLLSIGDMTWGDYEITVPITLNAPLDPYAPFAGPNFGVGMRWQGHYDSSYNQQPREGWYPLGALGVYIWDGNHFRLRIIGNGMNLIAEDTSGKQLEVGVTYVFKMRAETIGTGTLYSLKVWEQGTNEPAAWTISGYGPSGELKQGSALLNTHFADVSYGNVNIRSAPFDTKLVISDVSVDTYANSANVKWITNILASSNVSYGLSTAYENDSVVDGTNVLSHSIVLNGLQQGTTYHYKINSTDITGNSTNTTDLTFTTPIVSPSFSDDFNAPTLDTSKWTIVNPKGDATITVIGNGTSDALLSIAVPGGQEHDVWITNNAPRIMQPIANKDFEIEVKFQSQTTLAYQMQGVIIEQDSNNYLRFDMYTNPTNPNNIFAASFSSGNGQVKYNAGIPSGNPLYMRINRTGDQWRQKYSYDGKIWVAAANFSYPMIVSSIGPFAGNAIGTSSPAFTGLVDYFFDTSSPKIPEDTPLPASIAVQPVNTTGFNGSTATFSVVAGGTPPLSYQWKKNGSDIPGAIGSSYTTPILDFPDNGTKFSVVVSNVYGTVTSNEVTLLVTSAPTITWWDTQRNFRIPVTVNSAQYERNEKPAEVSLDFTQILGTLGQAGTFDETSIRVVETDSTGMVLNSTVPFQFDKDTGFNAVTKASGTIVFIMSGNTPANTNRYYHVYFGLAGNYYSPLSVTPRLTLTDNVQDQGQSSYQIGAAGSTYYFQKQAGGFSSLVDASGNDWISYQPTPALSSGGAYRGIPNVYTGGIFHPGFTCCTSTIVTQGPLKIRVRSVSPDGLWEDLWDFYPGYATNTMVKAGGNYWWLYEGTPGGSLDPNDFMVRSDNRKTMLSVSTNDDIPTNEWVYFSDPAVNRSLFVSHHEDDSLIDGYFPMTDSGGSMTVFGFGRQDNIGGKIPSSSAPQHFTMGLMDGTEFAQSSKTVYSAYKDLSITTDAAEQFSPTPPIIVTQPAGKTVPLGTSATFSVVAAGTKPLYYQWQKNNTDIPGATNASYTIPSTIQSDNGAVYRVIVTNSIGTVTSNQATLTIGALSNPNQLVLLDVNYTHTTSTMGFSFFAIPSNVPGNLVSPVNFAGGTIYQRLQVITKPSTRTVRYQYCTFQDDHTSTKHACTDDTQMPFTGTGTYYASQPMASMYQYGNIDWSRHLLDQMLVIKDQNGNPVDNQVGFAGNWLGSPDSSLYYPMEIRYKAILIPPGGGDPVWDSAPDITTQPADQNVTVGSTATFSVVASGAPPLNYQWQKNGVNIIGASSPSYTTPATTAADNGSRYRVIVTNDVSSVTSNEAVLTIPVDPIPPAVIGNLPTGTNVPYATKITVSFSEVMNKSSAESAFSAVPNIQGGSFSWIGNNMTYTPITNLAFNTTYNVTIGIGAKDLYGNNMSSQYQWQFTTKDQDLTPPSVIGNSPNGTNISVAARITVNFSEEMNQSTVISSFSTNPLTTGSFSWIGNNVTYTPVSNLAYNTTYNVIIGTGAKDLADNNMSSAYSWPFTTIPDTMPPLVIGNTPNGTNVPALSSINVTFNEAMDKLSAQSAFSTFPVISGGNFSWNGNSMIYTPTSNLAYNTIYNVTVGTGAKDLAGNNLAASYTWQFTTASQQPNLISNGGFESGTTSWQLYASGGGMFTTPSPGFEGNNAAKLDITSSGSNIQFYQIGVTLEANTRYRLSFAAYSNTGHDVTIRLFQHISPYTSYAPDFTPNLGTSWSTFTTEFTSPSFAVNDGRFQFWLSPFAGAGDIYYIDNIRLEKVV